MPTPSQPPQIRLRDLRPRVAWSLEQAGIHPLLARLFAARNVTHRDELDDALALLLPPSSLKGGADAARRLADAIERRERICVVADYDCDGATACAVALRGLRLLGAHPAALGYVVPDRALHGYGLSPALADLALQAGPALLVTVDNGISALAGVAHARARGADVIVTDHHLPAFDGERVVMPEGAWIVNPNQPGCAFGSKALAGVGVMFYLLLGVRAELRARGRFDAAAQPKLDALLDLVALGTVADVVALDANNRRLVAQGLKRIRAGRMQPGIAALFAVAGRDPARAGSFDLGFAVGPRVNAAGRLADMRVGIECLLADEPSRAAELARTLDAINRERRDVEAAMHEQARLRLDALLQEVPGAGASAPAALCLFDPTFHEGVVGIVASRLKDHAHRPAFVFASGRDGMLKGSGRSIAGFHLRDALDLIGKRHPGLLVRFGGHAMAAGCTVAPAGLETFAAALARIAAEWIEPAQLQRVLLSDGPLAAQWLTPDTIRLLDSQVWGQAFDAPRFADDMEVVQQRVVGDKHLKLRVRHDGVALDAIWFGRLDPLPGRCRLVYRPALDEYESRQRVQLVVEALG